MKPIATQEAVFAAADALVAAGIAEPSTKEVRERTGGSYTTVARHLEAWVEQRRKEASSIDLPAEIAARGQEFVRGIYAHAIKAANAAVAEPLAAAQGAQARAESLLSGAEAEVRRLEEVEQAQGARLDELTERARGLEVTLSARDAALAEKTAALGRLEDQLAEAQRGLTANAQELAELRVAARTHEALQGQLEALQRTVQGLTGGNVAGGR